MMCHERHSIRSLLNQDAARPDLTDHRVHRFLQAARRLLVRRSPGPRLQVLRRVGFTTVVTSTSLATVMWQREPRPKEGRVVAERREPERKYRC